MKYFFEEYPTSFGPDTGNLFSKRFEYGHAYQLRMDEILHRSGKPELYSQKDFLHDIDTVLSPSEQCTGRIIPENMDSSLSMSLLMRCPIVTTIIDKGTPNEKSVINLTLTRLAHLLFKQRFPVSIQKLENLYHCEYPLLPKMSNEYLVEQAKQEPCKFIQSGSTITTIYAVNDIKVEKLANDLGPYGLCYNCLPLIGINDSEDVVCSPHSTQNALIISKDNVVVSKLPGAECALLGTYCACSVIFRGRAKISVAKFTENLEKNIKIFELICAKKIDFDMKEFLDAAGEAYEDVESENCPFPNIFAICEHMYYEINMTIPRQLEAYELLTGPVKRYVNGKILRERVKEIERVITKIITASGEFKLEISKIVELFKNESDDWLIDFNIGDYFENIKPVNCNGKMFASL